MTPAAVVGLNVRIIVQVCAGARTRPSEHVPPVMMKSPGVPVVLVWKGVEKVTEPVPMTVTVTVLEAEMLPTVVSAKIVGERAAERVNVAATPVPVKTSVITAVAELIVSVVVLEPAAEGVNVTVMVQVSPGFMTSPFEHVPPNRVNSVPVNPKNGFRSVRMVLPEFVTV